MSAREGVKINRAPVLTLWAAVVARRMGYAESEALSLGRAVAGLTAQSKGRRLGIYSPAPEAKRAQVAAEREAMGSNRLAFMGREIACIRSEDGVRALSGTSPITPESVEKYLASKFKEHLPIVRESLEKLAEAYSPEDLEARAMDLYMQLRPQTPKGEQGWGRAGLLDLGKIARLADEADVAGA
ncbi:MAG: hypothetical protein JSW65_00655 [Candidatus Bipolaricaulota bacterium]|nr:MAG: hypothetical protein JSW65_00655 [Candidatus Bipolaricaulota bacterium]